MLLPIQTSQGKIYWIEEERTFYFDNVSLSTEDDNPIVESAGEPLIIQCRINKT